MTARPRVIAYALVALALLIGSLPASAAPPRDAKTDVVHTAPDFDSLGVKSIAMLPVATFDKNTKAEVMLTLMWAQHFKGHGYRWASAPTTRTMLMTFLGDSIVPIVREEILENVRVDSLLAMRMCDKLNVDAVLCLRVDQWEQQQIEINQAGRPMTSISLKAALVGSSGRLLWSASGAHTGEGPYIDPTTAVTSVKGSGLFNQPDRGQGGAPSFDDVLNQLLSRWEPQFPRAPRARVPAK